jgi:hypothetical protein
VSFCTERGGATQTGNCAVLGIIHPCVRTEKTDGSTSSGEQ